MTAATSGAVPGPPAPTAKAAGTRLLEKPTRGSSTAKAPGGAQPPGRGGPRGGDSGRSPGAVPAVSLLLLIQVLQGHVTPGCYSQVSCLQTGRLSSTYLSPPSRYLCCPVVTGDSAELRTGWVPDVRSPRRLRGLLGSALRLRARLLPGCPAPRFCTSVPGDVKVPRSVCDVPHGGSAGTRVSFRPE